MSPREVQACLRPGVKILAFEDGLYFLWDRLTRRLLITDSELRPVLGARIPAKEGSR